MVIEQWRTEYNSPRDEGCLREILGLNRRTLALSGLRCECAAIAVARDFGIRSQRRAAARSTSRLRHPNPASAPASLRLVLRFEFGDLTSRKRRMPPPPPPPPPPLAQAAPHIVLRGVHFNFNKYNIRADDAAVLDEAAAALKPACA